MPPSSGHRAGMAIVRVELEHADPARLLLRVTTVDDVTRRESMPAGEPFADVDAAIRHLRAWLDRWVARGDAGVTKA